MKQENQEDLEDVVLKENLVKIVKENLVYLEGLVDQEKMEKMVLLVNQEGRDKREIKVKEIFLGKILRDTGG